MTLTRLRSDLRKIFRSSGFTTDAGLLLAFATDLSPFLVLDRKLGRKPRLPLAVVFPESEKQVSRFLQWATRSKTAVIPYGGGSGVVGGTVVIKPSVVLSLGRLNRLVGLDRASGLVSVQAGMYGPDLERELNREGFTLGHFPASFQLSTVGGWLAARSAGQNSTFYGKIEDMVVSIRVALADGRIVETVPAPRSATGPNLVQLFVGSEGTLGVILEATLRIWPAPEEKIRQSYDMPSYSEAVDAIRRLVQAGYRPAVLRLYDESESAWYASRFKWVGNGCLLILVWEGNRDRIREEAERGRQRLESRGRFTGTEPAERWEARRFEQVDDYRKILDRADPVLAETIEISALWKDVMPLYETVKGRVKNMLCTAHVSHAYPEGAGEYFTFVIQGDSMKEIRRRYDELWKIVMKSCLDHGAAISHHHGIGLQRSPWMARSLGTGLDVMRQLKKALDPAGILNPGKLGL